MEGVDKITLELLMNKSQYNKYLAIKDPNKYEELQQHLEKVAKYKDRIMQITDEYCENHNTQNSIELDEAFSNYLKSCIRFIEMKELEVEPKYERDIEDVMFERCDDPNPMKSFWGKGAVKKNM
ncbi:MAG: hypothetical protein ACOVRN_19215 [Flavobacterium sp.]